MHAEQSRSTASMVTLIRLDPGDMIHDSLVTLMDRSSCPGAMVVSAIGSLSELSYSHAQLGQNGVPTYSAALQERGSIEIAALQGHLGRCADDEPQIHLHGVFATADGRVVAGHLHTATVLVTAQIGLLCPTDISWRGSISEDPRHPGLPMLDPAPLAQGPRHWTRR